MASGYKHLRRYLACLAISLLALSIPLLLIFNAKAMLFNMLLVPLRHPFLPSNKIYALFLAAKELTSACLLPMIIIIVYLLHQYRRKPAGEDKDLRAWLNLNPWLIYVIVGLCMTPTALIARAKIGGILNSLTLVLYFLLIAVLLILIQTQNSASALLRRSVRFLVWFIVIASPLLQVNSFYYFKKGLREIGRNPHQIAYEYAKAHPAEVYFPNHPLSSIMAEGKFYHTEFGLWDRDAAGYKINQEQLKSYLPSKIRIAAYATGTHDDNHPTLKKYLPEFSREVTIEELKDYWLVYTKE
jgi:hypothetical protein